MTLSQAGKNVIEVRAKTLIRDNKLTCVRALNEALTELQCGLLDEFIAGESQRLFRRTIMDKCICRTDAQCEIERERIKSEIHSDLACFVEALSIENTNAALDRMEALAEDLKTHQRGL